MQLRCNTAEMENRLYCHDLITVRAKGQRGKAKDIVCTVSVHKTRSLTEHVMHKSNLFRLFLKHFV